VVFDLGFFRYQTNIPANVLEAKSIAQIYTCRWQVELVFKELKSHYRFDE
jgi:IS4 transposase